VNRKYRHIALGLAVVAILLALIDFEYDAYRETEKGTYLVARFVYADYKWFFVALVGFHSLLFFFLPNQNVVRATDYLYYGLISMGVLSGVTLGVERTDLLEKNIRYQEFTSAVVDFEGYCFDLVSRSDISIFVVDQLYPYCDALEGYFFINRYDLTRSEITNAMQQLQNLYISYARTHSDLLAAPLSVPDRTFLSSVNLAVRDAGDKWEAALGDRPLRQGFIGDEVLYGLLRLWPILIYLALAIRLTRVTAELSYLRK